MKSIDLKKATKASLLRLNLRFEYFSPRPKLICSSLFHKILEYFSQPWFESGKMSEMEQKRLLNRTEKTVEEKHK